MSKRMSTKGMSRIPTYEEVVNGMNNAKDPFYGRYPDFSNTLATKTPEFKQLLGESLNQLQEQQIREAKQNQLHELFRTEAQQSGRSFNEINAEHRRPLSISSHLGASHEEYDFFDMDVEDQETKMLQNIETQTEPQPKRKLLYEKIVWGVLATRAYGSRICTIFFICYVIWQWVVCFGGI